MAQHAPLIVPSVLPADAARLGAEVEDLCSVGHGTRTIHVLARR